MVADEEELSGEVEVEVPGEGAEAGLNGHQIQTTVILVNSKQIQIILTFLYFWSGIRN